VRLAHVANVCGVVLRVVRVGASSGSKNYHPQRIGGWKSGHDRLLSFPPVMTTEVFARVQRLRVTPVDVDLKGRRGSAPGVDATSRSRAQCRTAVHTFGPHGRPPPVAANRSFDPIRHEN